MARFNETKATGTTKTKSHEGGDVYVKNALDEWLNMLFSSYLEDGFYEDRNSYVSRMVELTQKMIDEYGADFVAKASLFARNEIGMRSVSHLVAAILNWYKFDRKRSYYRNFCARPDDMGEVFSACEALGIKRSHAMIRGFNGYAASLDEYRLAKYRGDGRTWSLVDVVNLLHASSPAIDKLMRGELKASDADTINSVLTQNADDDSRAAKFRELIQEGKMGYLMLIRNLNHIWYLLNDEPEIIDKVCEMLANEKAVINSKVFPYQIYSAYKNYAKKTNDVHSGLIDTALARAFRYSCANVPHIDGKVALVLDVSGSMWSPISGHSDITISEAGACMCAALHIMNPEADVYKFANECAMFNYPAGANVFDMIKTMIKNYGYQNLGGGTIIGSFYDKVIDNKLKYDSVFIFSDMQVMDTGNSSPHWLLRHYSTTSFDDFDKALGGNYELYSFDLGNYHTQISPQKRNIHYFTSLSRSAFDFIQMVENHVDIKEYIEEKYANAF